ncbi:hypothetical protein K1W54_29735 [Micromonospora sp. CPCC 205371]|nr:hypothetical protein [Micromonospora sp. CPCC 205371]
MTAGTVEQRLTSLFARSTTAALVDSLRTLDATPPSPERNWARAKTIEELERRYPAAAQAVEDAFYAAEFQIENGVDVPVDYVAVLIAAIPAEEIR